MESTLFGRRSRKQSREHRADSARLAFDDSRLCSMDIFIARIRNASFRPHDELKYTKYREVCSLGKSSLSDMDT